MNRPGLEEMLYDAESQAFDTLLVFRVDRLSRKVRELAQMVDELTKYNVVLKASRSLSIQPMPLNKGRRSKSHVVVAFR